MKPHIVFYGAATLHVGGVERNLLQQIDHFSDHYQFTVISPASQEFQQNLTQRGASYIESGIPHAFSLRAIRQLTHHLQHAHLLVTFEPRGLTIGALAGRVAGMPVIHRHSISPLDYTTNPFKKLVYAAGETFILWALLKAVIFVSENKYHFYTRYLLAPAANSFYIPISVDAAAYQKVRQQRNLYRQQWGIAPDEFLWVNLGRCHAQKAQEVLIQAAALLPQNRRWKLLIAGGGELESVLQNQIQQAGLQQRVGLVGGLPHTEAVQLLAAADGFVLPSRYENRPNAVLEAMAMAVPCIVTDVGDSWLMSGGDNLPPASLCVPVEDAVALAQAMNHLMEDEGLHQRLSGAGPERAALFQPEILLSQIETLYRTSMHG